MLKTYYSLLVLAFLSSSSISQTLIMNEVSQGEAGNMEYVEFVVIDTTVTYDCASGLPPSIDIRGWIFDDNSGYHGAGGVAPGAIRFSFDPMWGAVPLGTIILIYNPSDPNTELPADDISMADGNCKIVAPVSDPNLFESNATTPGAIACSYPAAGWTPGGNWGNTLLRNGGDCARIVDLSGCEVFSVCWVDNNLNTQIYFAGGATSGVSATNTVYYFNDVDPSVQANWSIGCADQPACGIQEQTPGAPNNAANAAYISSFNNSCSPIPPIVANAIVDNDEICGCDGQATASGSGSIPGYTYIWMDDTYTPIGQTTATATNLCAGTYYVEVTSSIGCADTTTVTIAPSGPAPTAIVTNSGPYCQGDPIALSESGGDASSWLWVSDGAAVITNTTDQNPTVTGAIDGETFTVTITDANGCTDTAQTTIIINPTPVATAINSGPYCTGDSMDVTETGGAATGWSWVSDGTAVITNATDQNPVITGAVDGETFTVSITDTNGCTNTAQTSITINSLPNAVAGNSGPVCSGDSINLTETGGDGNSWLWVSDGAATITNNTDQNPSASGIIDGETFTVTVTDVNGCVSAAQTTITVVASPVLDPISDVVACDSYDLPVPITGTGLTGNQNYYNGSQTNGGNIISGTLTTSQIVYVYDGASGCEDEISFNVDITPCDTIPEPEVIIPTAFTPDGDQVNDYWNIKHLDIAYPNNMVYVYNRWGSLLYESIKGKYDEGPWRGVTRNGEKLPVGSYYYIIDLTEDGGKTQNGTVSIIK